MTTKTKAQTEMEWWHHAVFGDRPFRDAIPFRVMREYEDEKVFIRQAKNGLHNVTVTVSAASTNIALLDTERLLDSDITIRVSGQQW
jgi:hypothetical protein